MVKLVRPWAHRVEESTPRTNSLGGDSDSFFPPSNNNFIQILHTGSLNYSDRSLGGTKGFDLQVFFFLLEPFFLFFKHYFHKKGFCWRLARTLDANMMVGEIEVKERPRPSPDYLMQLLNEKKLMTSLPNLCGIFTHLERLLDEGKCRLEKWRLGGKAYFSSSVGIATKSAGMLASYIARLTWQASELQYRRAPHNFFF